MPTHVWQLLRPPIHLQYAEHELVAYKLNDSLKNVESTHSTERFLTKIVEFVLTLSSILSQGFVFFCRGGSFLNFNLLYSALNKLEVRITETVTTKAIYSLLFSKVWNMQNKKVRVTIKPLCFANRAREGRETKSVVLLLCSEEEHELDKKLLSSWLNKIVNNCGVHYWNFLRSCKWIYKCWDLLYPYPYKDVLTWWLNSGTKIC